MWEIIKKKINKKYPSHFSIVIHDSHNKGSVTSEHYRELHEKLKTCSISSGAIRFWMEITNKDARNVLIGELYPENTWTEFSTTHVIDSYSINPQTIKVDVISHPGRVVFGHDDLNVILPPLPELHL